MQIYLPPKLKCFHPTGQMEFLVFWYIPIIAYYTLHQTIPLLFYQPMCF